MEGVVFQTNESFFLQSLDLSRQRSNQRPHFIAVEECPIFRISGQQGEGEHRSEPLVVISPRIGVQDHVKAAVRFDAGRFSIGEVADAGRTAETVGG